MQVHGPT